MGLLEMQRAHSEKYRDLKEIMDYFVYIGLCVITFGVAYLLRLVITTALKKAK